VDTLTQLVCGVVGEGDAQLQYALDAKYVQGVAGLALMAVAGVGAGAGAGMLLAASGPVGWILAGVAGALAMGGGVTAGARKVHGSYNVKATAVQPKNDQDRAGTYSRLCAQLRNMLRHKDTAAQQSSSASHAALEFGLARLFTEPRNERAANWLQIVTNKLARAATPCYLTPPSAVAVAAAARASLALYDLRVLVSQYAVVAVIGTKNAGKSALLSAIAGQNVGENLHYATNVSAVLSKDIVDGQLVLLVEVGAHAEAADKNVTERTKLFCNIADAVIIVADCSGNNPQFPPAQALVQRNAMLVLNHCNHSAPADTRPREVIVKERIACAMRPCSPQICALWKRGVVHDSLPESVLGRDETIARIKAYIRKELE